MLKVQEENLKAAYYKEDLMEFFGKSERTIENYYKKGLKKRKFRGDGRNITLGHEIQEFIDGGGLEAKEEPVNPKLVKFRKQNFA